MTDRTITLRVQRQAAPTAAPRWEGFSLPWRPDLSVAACLAELRDRGPADDPALADPTTHARADRMDRVCGALHRPVRDAHQWRPLSRRAPRAWMISDRT